MAEIILTTLNAKYIHSSFGLRYLYANLGELQSRTELVEFNINQRPIDITEKLLQMQPKIIGFGIYIWNCNQSLQVIRMIKKINPDITIVIGGPEVSFEWEDQEIVKLADYCITGEADNTFRELCISLTNNIKPEKKLIFSKIPETDQVKMPYDFYTDQDIANRIIYVEASRGCPFTCEFCLSSLDVPVRQFNIENFLVEIEKLFKRGARQFKFVDRTFNLNLKISQSILQYFLDNYTEGLFVHFEMIPDRLPEGLRTIIKKFPKGALQFEVGIQSFNLDVNKYISRRQNFDKIAENIKYLREETGVHIHADLIAGLPGETYESFAQGFNSLYKYNPQEIQVGILKRLKGTPIVRHDQDWDMRYSADAPYEILSNKLVDFHTMQRISRFARYWDLFANSGNFLNSVTLVWHDSEAIFQEFMKFSDWIYAETNKRHAIALDKQFRLLERYLSNVKNIANGIIQEKIKADQLLHAGRKRLSIQISSENKESASNIPNKSLPTRQAKHVTLSQ